MEMTIEIPLSKGYVAIVDEEDADLALLKWYALISGNTTYAMRNGISMHRLILQRKVEKPLTRWELCDHINYDGLDNRRSNLRVATFSQNNANRITKHRSISGYRGVRPRYDGRWDVKFRAHNRAIEFGPFDTKEEAALAYNAAAIEEFGEYAVLNIIKE